MAAVGLDAPLADAVFISPRGGGARSRAREQVQTERRMIRVHPVATADDDMPNDPAMRLIEIGLAVMAIVAAAILAFIR
jgi:hypothetical protein